MNDPHDYDERPAFTVHKVNGRFPCGRSPLRQENITVDVSVTDDPSTFRIRLDSPTDHPDFWMELLLHAKHGVIFPNSISPKLQHDD